MASTRDNTKLIYIMGASGSGKDSLIRFVRSEYELQKNVIFAHRYITRPVEVSGENHVSLTYQEFLQREQAGCFAMSWRAHDNAYAIGVEIDHWLTLGMSVVVNGSRAYLEQARQRYPRLSAVLISAKEDTISQRLTQRAREHSDEIQQRLRRGREFNPTGKVHIIDNNAELSEAGQQLGDYLCRQ